MTRRFRQRRNMTTVLAVSWLLASWSLAPTHAQIPSFGDFQGLDAQATGGAGDVDVSAEFTRAQKDRTAVLIVTAEIEPGYHINSLDQPKTAEGFGPQETSIDVDESSDYRLLAPFQPIEEPNVHIDDVVWQGLELREHEGRVTWVAPIELTSGVDPGSLAITGAVAGQACANVCIPFKKAFEAQLGAGAPLPQDIDLTLAPVESGTDEAAQAAAHNVRDAAAADDATWEIDGSSAAQMAPIESYNLDRVELRSQQESPLWYYLATAFVGGIILNVMPCVLPVIGLKVMSFVQQAGESRARAWMLNLWYSLGIVAVFLVLAGLAVSLNLGWGDQFGSAAFNVALLAIVFAMALSLLGLWEIPIPGFVGSGAAVEMAEREGPLGAFLKGALTTVLATPCTGPFFVAALAWAIQQSPSTTFAVFGMLGLGMASPYLLIGAFPRLLRFMPKPGDWMETFKKVMGLVLLATVVWLLTFLDSPMVVPTAALMVGIAAACWWIGQTPMTATIGDKAYAWATAALFVAVVALGSYGWFYKDVMLKRHERLVDLAVQRHLGEERIALSQQLAKVDGPEQVVALQQQLLAKSGAAGGAWQPFTLDRLARVALQERRTVLVDFTADWCATCHVLEATVLKTDEVEAAIDRANIVTMIADYTDTPEWMTQTIRMLGGVGVPVIAIFPADDPYRPIVFPSGYTKSKLLAAIAEATGQSVTETASLAAPAAW